MEEISKKIVIDTDIGDDADDALALALALKSPELDVLGVTTVFRNTVARAKIAKRLLTILDRNDIPVYAGIGHPIIDDADTITPPIQYLEEMENLDINEGISAIEYIRRTIMGNPHEITLVTIGPLTNIAILIRQYPEVIPLVKEIVMMGGAFYFHYDEWNMFCDPEAASIVFSSTIPIKAIGLDVTLQCPVTEELYQEIRNHGGELTDLLGELLRRYKENRKRHTFLHDPLAIMSLFRPDLFEYRSEDVAVELKGDVTRGMTFRKSKIGVHTIPERNIYAASAVAAEKAVECFRERILS